MILYVLALGSPTHPIEPAAWTEWTKTYVVDAFLRTTARQFRAAVRPPVLARLDRLPRNPGRVHARQGNRLLRELAARDATRSARTRSPIRSNGETTAPDIWGLTAVRWSARHHCGDRRHDRDNSTPTRRAASPRIQIATTARSAPTAAGGSVPFAPEIAIPALIAMREKYGDNLFTSYGFLDSFNPDVPAGDHAAPRESRRRSGLVRYGLSRDRSGADHRDDRELPDGSDLEDDANESVHRGGAEKSRLHRRVAWELDHQESASSEFDTFST